MGEVQNSSPKSAFEVVAHRDPRRNIVTYRRLSSWKLDTDPTSPLSYDGILKHAESFSHQEAPLVELLQTLVETHKNPVWVDVGAGYGLALREARHRFPALKTYGVDPVDWAEMDPNILEKLTKLGVEPDEAWSNPQSRYTWIQAAAETVQLPEPPDLITAFYVSQYFDDPLGAIANLYNQLKLDGTLIFNVYPLLLHLGNEDRSVHDKYYFINRVLADLQTSGILVDQYLEEGVSSQTGYGLLVIRKSDNRRLEFNVLSNGQIHPHNGGLFDLAGHQTGRKHILYQQLDKYEPFVMLVDDNLSDKAVTPAGAFKVVRRAIDSAREVIETSGSFAGKVFIDSMRHTLPPGWSVQGKLESEFNPEFNTWLVSVREPNGREWPVKIFPPHRFEALGINEPLKISYEAAKSAPSDSTD